MEEERKLTNVKDVFQLLIKKRNRKKIIAKLDKELRIITKELDDSEKRRSSFEEQEEFANRLELKDGKCPVCDSKLII